MHSLTFTMKEDEDMSAFLAGCKGTWTDTVGSHPGSGQLQTTLFRNAVITGMPKEVKEAMESNPDIPGSSTEQWEKHLTHHMKHYRTKQDEDKQSNELAQVQLLKLQLDEARRKANDTKKASQKTTSQMVQRPSPQNNPPSLDPTPDWRPPYPQYGGRPIGVPGGIRGRGRGRGGFRGQPPNTCFECGQPGHWRRNCPMLWRPQGGQGLIRGQYVRSSQPPFQQAVQPYQVPNAAAAPVHGQYPQTMPEGQGYEY
ncbi:hypothetical protein chiPu_0027031 [Chiloscyllium punctatum]|uniref:CCHC-type domain-containing protein n=1 Tax=Chiloscyllium punctatum TaxID=137246 RepID=A0A401TKE5_CHIPU|nr:hypothetical protein [Chiloscyllium punctatum]